MTRTLYDEKSFPEATFTLIAINVIVFFLYLFGALDRLLPYVVAKPESVLGGNFVCLLTAGFIHQDIVHLVLNMLGIFIFGRIVERHFGATHTFGVYCGSLMFSMFLSTMIYALMQKEVAIIGASGALMGMIACAMLLEPFTITFEMVLPLPVMIKGWLFIYADVLGFLGGEQDNISHLAHLCGFVSIAFLVYFLNKEKRVQMARGLIINVISFAAFLIEQLIRYH